MTPTQLLLTLGLFLRALGLFRALCRFRLRFSWGFLILSISFRFLTLLVGLFFGCLCLRFLLVLLGFLDRRRLISRWLDCPVKHALHAAGTPLHLNKVINKTLQSWPGQEGD